MVITIVIVVRTILQRQISTFPKSSCYCPSTTVSFVQDSTPLRFLRELKRFAKVSSHIQVIWQDSWEISVLYYFLHSWHHGTKFSRCETSYKIERRFYHEVLSPDLNWRKQASKRFWRFRRLESLYLHESVRYFNRHPSLYAQTSGEKIS